MEELIKFDVFFFRLINNGCSNDLFDLILPLARNSLFWVPLYLFLIVFGFQNYKKNVWWWILFAIITVWMTDFFSSNIIKEHIFRLRPCNDPTALARLLVSYCPQSSSFTSSHATNHFGIAAFLYYTLAEVPRKWRNLLFVWAFLVIFAQVYVGVHYPLDVICGGMIGFVFGYLLSKAFNKIFGLA